MNIITIELILEIKKQYSLNWHGTHGILHWSHVYDNGMKLAEQDGVNPKVVQLFSVFHDSRRLSENWDPDHGKRGAEFAEILREFCPLDEAEFELLMTACRLHTGTLNHEDITVQTCFDADRLDLGRVGHYPDTNRLCTPEAKKRKTIEWAYHRSLNDGELPENPFELIGSDRRLM